jgi:hypothetical protein
MLNLNETTKGFELYKKQRLLLEVSPYLHHKHFNVYGQDIRCCLWTDVYCTCKKKKAYTTGTPHFPLLILTPSKFMLGLLAYDPVTSHSSSSCCSANSKLPISISDVYHGKFKRIKASFKTRRGKKKPLYVLLVTGIKYRIRNSF